MNAAEARETILKVIIANLEKRNYATYELLVIKFWFTLDEVARIFNEIGYFEEYLAFKLLMKTGERIEVQDGMCAALADFIRKNEESFKYSHEAPDPHVVNAIAKALDS